MSQQLSVAPTSRRPRRTLLAAACVAGGALVLPFGASPGPAVAAVGVTALVPTPAVGAEAGADALSLLEKAYSRSRIDTYHGVELVMVDNQSHQVRVSHVPGHTYLFTDGSSQAYESSDSAPAGSSLDPLSKDPLALLKAHYRLTVLGTETVVGRPAVVISAVSAAGATVAQFWVDKTSSLLVRRDTYDTMGNVYSRVAFTELVVSTADPELSSLTSTPLRPDGTAEDAGQLAALRGRGWWAGSQLPGGLTLFDAREVTSAGATVLHLSYSDGISSVSVFEQRGRLAAGALPTGWRTVTLPDGRVVLQADGVPVRAAWQADQLVVAVIADVPPAAVPAVVAALPYGALSSGKRSVIARVHRGLGRIGSALNPFG